MPKPAELVYNMITMIASRLGLYTERTEKYFGFFQDCIKKDMIVLDVGSGGGFFSEVCAKRGSIVISLDVNIRQLKGYSKDKRIHRICGDAQSLPLRENSIDVVIAISLLEHLQKPNLAIKDVERVLRLGGLFVVQLPNVEYYIEPHTKLPLPFLLPTFIKYGIIKQLDYDYVNYALTLKKTLQLARNLFATRRIVPIYHKLKTPPWPPAWIIYLQKSGQDNPVRCAL